MSGRLLNKLAKADWSLLEVERIGGTSCYCMLFARPGAYYKRRERRTPGKL